MVEFTFVVLVGVMFLAIYACELLVEIKAAINRQTDIILNDDNNPPLG